MNNHRSQPECEQPSIAAAGARQAAKLTFAIGAVEGGLFGMLLGVGIALISTRPALDIAKGLVMALPAGFVFGAMMSLFFDLILAVVNSVAVAAITALSYRQHLSVRVYRWILLLVMPNLDMLAMWLLWHREDGDETRRFILGVSMLAAGVGAIIGSVLLSRWYSRLLSLQARYFELIALGYNPDIADR